MLEHSGKGSGAEARMPGFAWERRFATGLPGLDAEHKALFRVVRGIQACVEAGGDWEEGRRRLDGLIAALEAHGVSEEAEMERLGFPGLAAHRESHAMLRQRLEAIRLMLQQSQADASLAISRLLYEWLRDHMLQDDLTFAEFLRAQASAGSAGTVPPGRRST